MKRSENHQSYRFLKEHKADLQWRARYLKARQRRMVIGIVGAAVALAVVVGIILFRNGDKNNPPATSATSTYQVTSETSSTSASSTATSASSRSETITTSESSESAETAETSERDSASSVDRYPYAVSVNELSRLRFSFSGFNMPTYAEIKFDANGEGTVTFVSVDPGDPTISDTTILAAKVKEIPTREIRIFSAGGASSIDESVRTIKANTEIRLGQTLSDDKGRATMFTYDLYLMYNKNGEITLITPNYAGNIPMEYVDVMVEVPLQK